METLEPTDSGYVHTPSARRRTLCVAVIELFDRIRTQDETQRRVAVAAAFIDARRMRRRRCAPKQLVAYRVYNGQW